MTAIANAKMLLFAELGKLYVITFMIRSKLCRCECFVAQLGLIRFIFCSNKWQRKLFRKPFSKVYSSAMKESIFF